MVCVEGCVWRRTNVVAPGGRGRRRLEEKDGGHWNDGELLDFMSTYPIQPVLYQEYHGFLAMVEKVFLDTHAHLDNPINPLENLTTAVGEGDDSIIEKTTCDEDDQRRHL
ncbi:hypothetical protein Tco_0898477 [Tanacetum coccineum]